MLAIGVPSKGILGAYNYQTDICPSKSSQNVTTFDHGNTFEHLVYDKGLRYVFTHNLSNKFLWQHKGSIGLQLLHSLLVFFPKHPHLIHCTEWTLFSSLAAM